MSKGEIKLIKMHDEHDGDPDRIIRVAIYARYSSVGNAPYSAVEQIQRIRYHVENGAVRSRRFPIARLKVDENWVIKDEAQTGRTSSREGYEMIKSGVRTKRFEMLLVDDISRTTRDMGDTLDLYEDLIFAGVEGYSLSDHISTVDANARDLFFFKGYANEQQSKNIGKSTSRGLEVRVLGGYSTGHNPYGYYSEPTRRTPIKGIEKLSHFEIKLRPDEVAVVQKIWTLFAEGLGCGSIAKTLNKDGIPAPGKRGCTKAPEDRRWSVRTVWNFLHQEKYVGIWKYRMTKVVKNPQKNKLGPIERPKPEWLVSEREDLRIVPRDLEFQVKKRFQDLATEREAAKTTEKSLFSNHGKPSTHIFTGSMSCSECGGNFITATGRHGGYVGCNNGLRQTGTKCDNRQIVQLRWVEWHLIDELRKVLDSPAFYEELARRYNNLMAKKHGDLPHKLSQLSSERAQLAKTIANYAAFIASGHYSETIVKGLAEAEQRQKEVKTAQAYLEEQTRDRVYITAHAIRERVSKLDEILGQKVVEANLIIKRIFHGKITMTPVLENKRKLYRASGEISLHGLLKKALQVGQGMSAENAASIGAKGFVREIVRPLQTP